MHKVVALTVLVAVAAVLVFAERCHHYNDCMTTQCGNDSHVICEKDTCTCVSHITCNDAADCNNAGRCDKRDQHFHCLDSFCICLKDDIIDHPPH